MKYEDWLGFSPRGWHGILKKTFAKFSDDVKILQVKEKFGGLRLYINSPNAKDHDVVRKAESMCWYVCERCGTTLDVTTEPNPGRYWVKTLCGSCRAEEIDGLRAAGD